MCRPSSSWPPFVMLLLGAIRVLHDMNVAMSFFGFALFWTEESQNENVYFSFKIFIIIIFFIVASFSPFLPHPLTHSSILLNPF